MSEPILKIDSDTYHEFLIGITSNEPEYHVAWLLNNTLGWKLSQDNDEVFRCKIGDTARCAMTQNVLPERVLLKEWKSSDFLLFVSQEGDSVDKSLILKQLQGVRGIVTAFEIPVNKKILSALKGL